MNTIQFATLNYYNSIVSDECLCIGILFYNLTTGERTFNHIKNFKRLASFDDEINIEFFKLYLDSIKDEVEINILNYKDEFNMNDYINTYVNELRFSKIVTMETSDFNFIDNITKIYLKYDLETKERLNNATETKYIKQIIKSKNMYLSTRPVVGLKNENISFDFQNDSYAIKLFTFKDKNPNKLIASAKLWSYNAHEMQKMNKQAIFIYDFNEECKDNFKIIIEILSEYTDKVFSLQDGIEYVSNIC